MKNIKLSGQLYFDLEQTRNTFQKCDKRKYSIPQTIKRLLELARSEGLW